MRRRLDGNHGGLKEPEDQRVPMRFLSFVMMFLATELILKFGADFIDGTEGTEGTSSDVIIDFS